MALSRPSSSALSSRRFLLVGRTNGWQGLYWTALAEALRSVDCEAHIFDYAIGDTPGLLERILPGDAEARRRKRRTMALIAELRDVQPDVLLVHTLRFDLELLREAYLGTLVLWDLDGPAGFLEGGEVPESAGFDLVVSVSRATCRELVIQDSVPVRYLPNGVSTANYRPGPLEYADRRRFGSSLACIGSASPRRVEHYAQLAEVMKAPPPSPDSTQAPPDLVLWGRRWHQPPFNHSALQGCYRERNDVEGREALSIYRASDVMLNVLREPFVSRDLPTTMNLEVFHTLSSGTCLLTEWVEELEDAFEPGLEVLTFRTPDELCELAMRYAIDTHAARAIGKAGRRRCEAEHTLAHRAHSLLRFLDEIS
ncbi:MAG: glycosyltransferase [Myxococcota bacterium]|nr:glycosyltransferase [Myxococcota bacterium]